MVARHTCNVTEGFESHLCPQSACRQNHEVIAATMRNDSIGKQEVRFAGRMYADGVMVAHR